MKRLGPLFDPRFGMVALALAALLVLPDAAHACPVCFDSTDENRRAFIVTTAFLTLLPLGMVGGLGLWLRKRAREVGPGPEGESPSEPTRTDG